MSVFVDSNDGVPLDEKWKMVCSANAYASPDGLKWTKLGAAKQDEDDTKPTAYCNYGDDKDKGKYTVVVRRGRTTFYELRITQKKGLSI